MYTDEEEGHSRYHDCFSSFFYYEFDLAVCEHIQLILELYSRLVLGGKQKSGEKQYHSWKFKTNNDFVQAIRWRLTVQQQVLSMHKSTLS